MFVNKSLQTLWVYNSRILKNKNAKFPGYYFGMDANILGDFKICISVPLRNELGEMLKHSQLCIFVPTKLKSPEKH